MPEIPYNPLDPTQLRDPYPLYARAHREAPVFFSETFQLWVVTRYEDIWTVLKDPARFSSAVSTTPGAAPPPEVTEILATGWPAVPTLVTNDPPSHHRFRSLINKAFTPRRVAEKEGRVREIAEGLVDAIAATGQADLVWQFAYPLPMTVIAEILGVPRAEMDRFKKWSDDIVAQLSIGLSPERQIACARSLVEFQHSFAEKIEERRRSPRDDMLTDLLAARIEGEAPLELAEMLSMLQQLLVAGNETTTNLIGSMAVLVLEQPGLWTRLAQEPESIPAIVEEALRMESPVQGLFRTTTAEVELGGVRLPRGAHLQLLYGAGNRDEKQFPAPGRFDASRENVSTHLAFGGGIHFCIGASLARMEARIALETLTRRLPEPRIASGFVPSRATHFFLRGYEHLRVTWETT